MTLRALDLFCGAGGASMGLHRVGFEVTGVDIRQQWNYKFEFIKADVLSLSIDITVFDLIWASPPCQAFTSLKSAWNAKHHPNLIPPVRDMLARSGTLYVIENVVGAPLRSPIMLCGTMFDLGWNDAELRRHRLFETNFIIPKLYCKHSQRPRVIGVYGGHGRDRRRICNTQDFPTNARRAAMNIDWMTGTELSQAIPPDYAEHIGRAAIVRMQA